MTTILDALYRFFDVYIPLINDCLRLIMHLLLRLSAILGLLLVVALLVKLLLGLTS